VIIQPKFRGFICTAAHPSGCGKVVAEQIEYIKASARIEGLKNVLIIGASTGYGLASRIAATFGAGAKTIGVFFEKEAGEKRTASAGWYNTAAFENYAHKDQYYAKSINGDAFSQSIKQQTADLIRKDLGQVDLIIYSLAAPRRIHPATQQIFSSVLKPIGQKFVGKTVDPLRAEVKEISLEPATAEEISHTVAVMGGEDWEMWLDFLAQENLLAKGIVTLAYDYVGPALTYPIYKEGTIGKAKEHLLNTAKKLQLKLSYLQGRVLISVNKALVTQASSAIPVVPLYISLLYKKMKAEGTHESCIEQMYRLLKDNIYTKNPSALDNSGRIRLDDLEMEEVIQTEITALWPQVTTENLAKLTDIAGYCNDFYHLFGFAVKGIDYAADVNTDVRIPSIASPEKLAD
jgi:enoyl-[acyl-carrier protein] reductase/trans-2-enoyl-CoA reductase (NAD+)